MNPLQFYGVFTLTKTASDTEAEKKMACMKLYKSVHTDRDPLIIEFHGVGIDLWVGVLQCEWTITRNPSTRATVQHKVTKHRKEQPSTISINVNDIEMVTYHQITSS